MLGPPKQRDLNRPVLVSLEQLVPADHFYCHLEATLYLCFVRDWVKARYGDRDRPSIDLVVFFKLQLIEIASLDLAHRWYLGYNLDEPLPDHSSLSRIRQRLDSISSAGSSSTWLTSVRMKAWSGAEN